MAWMFIYPKIIFGNVMPINKWVDEENVICVCVCTNVYIHTHIWESGPAMCNMREPGGLSDTWENSDAEGQTSHYITRVRTAKQPDSQTQSEVVAVGAGGRGNAEVIKGYKFQSHKGSPGELPHSTGPVVNNNGSYPPKHAKKIYPNCSYTK